MGRIVSPRRNISYIKFNQLIGLNINTQRKQFFFSFQDEQFSLLLALSTSRSTILLDDSAVKIISSLLERGKLFGKASLQRPLLTTRQHLNWVYVCICYVCK